MKVIAWYLPQFHEIPENSAWWGPGFTDWVNVKKGRRYAPEQRQPRVPLNENYYDLSKLETLQWQVDLANQYGVYGFCFHHYWFGGKLLLEKPMEMFLAHPELDLHFCINWANEHWTTQWNGSNKILIEQDYGGKEEWIEHFNYLLPFFRDPRYITKAGKPLFVFYHIDDIPCLSQMMDCWQEQAKKAGLPGLCFVYAVKEDPPEVRSAAAEKFDYCVDYQPAIPMNEKRKKKWYAFLYPVQSFLAKNFSKALGIDIQSLSPIKLKKYDYTDCWQKILQLQPAGPHHIPGAFSDWDNTPRKQERGSYFIGATPEIFYQMFKRQIIHAREAYKQDMIFIFAWNEWAEGGYLEPDTQYGCGYLQAIRRALEETGELETRI